MCHLQIPSASLHLPIQLTRKARRLLSELLLKIFPTEDCNVQKLLSLTLAAVLINLAAATPAYAVSREAKDARFAEKVKASVLGWEPANQLELGSSCGIRRSWRGTLALLTAIASRS